ncbi:hypothetical protein ABIB48_003723, partial [Arthrobacter sp. UYCu511]
MVVGTKGSPLNEWSRPGVGRLVVLVVLKVGRP